jgi:hypothetical protein
MWRPVDDLPAYPATLTVRPLTVGEWQKLQTIEEGAQHGYILENCARIDGVPGGLHLDVHVATVLIKAVMANPWNGPQQTASSDC